ncbi:MAG: hypothetical protein OSA39_07950 [Sphingobium sp.]|nr:hypothetical protein [Sphingobium sp.]
MHRKCDGVACGNDLWRRRGLGPAMVFGYLAGKDAGERSGGTMG